MSRCPATVGKRSPLVRWHIFATWCASISILIMGMHSLNITLPWTIGVFMVRNFVGIGKLKPVPSSPSMPSEMIWSGEQPASNGTVATAPSTSADFVGIENLLGGDNSSERQQPEIVPPEVPADWSNLEAHVGYQAGILSSAFSIAQVSAALANLALGFAPTFWWAVAARFVGGLMNSITGANKTNIAHSFHLAHQPYVFGLTMSCWAAGSIASPIVGGLLAEPCSTWTSMASSRHCAPGALLVRFPFMLPCTLVAAMFLISFALSAFALSRSEDVLAAWPLEDSEEEPLFGDAALASDADGCDSDSWVLGDGAEDRMTITNNAETENVLGGALGVAHAPQMPVMVGGGQEGPEGTRQRGSIELSQMHDTGQHPHGEPVPDIPDLASKVPNSRRSAGVPADTNLKEKASSLVHCGSNPDILSSGARKVAWWKDRQVQLRLVGYSALAIMFSILAESIPIYAAMPLRHRGLGWSSLQLAAPMSAGGLSLMFSATILYPKVNKALGNRRTCIAGLIVLIPATILYPNLSFIAKHTHLTMAGMAALGACTSVAINFTFASGNVLVNEAASTPELKSQIGSVNGAGHMLASAVRAIGPAMAGAVWSMITATDVRGGVFIPFAICTALAIVNIKLYASM